MARMRGMDTAMLLLGGVTIAVVGYFALEAFGFLGPKFTFTPNRIPVSYESTTKIKSVLSGFKPSEFIIMDIKRPDGTSVGKPGNPFQLDSTGGWSVDVTAGIFRLMAVFLNAPIQDWKATGQSSGLVAKARMVVEMSSTTQVSVPTGPLPFGINL